MKTWQAMRRLTLMIFSALVLFTVACGDSSDSNSPPAEEERFFEVAYEKEVEVEEIDRDAVDALTEANQNAAFRFYQKLRASETNLIFSPLSFSRVFAGYYSETHPEAAAFEALFGYSEDGGDPAFWPQLTHLATNRDEFEDVPADERSTFETKDVYWVDPAMGMGGADYSFFDLVHETPLSSRPEQSREAINDWVERESEGMLIDFLPPGSINIDTEAVATNLVFFLGAWAVDFEDADAIDFQGASGSTSLEAFGGTGEMLAESTEDVTIVGIPYAHGYTHWVIMPHSDFDAFAQNLDLEAYRELRQSASTYDVTLKMPEFEVGSTPDMVGAIDTLREETDTKGDTLSGAYRETYLHKAAMEVTNEGTRAAAVSAVIEYANNAPEPNPTLDVTVDRPFVHLIIDDRSSNILFLGEYTGPE